MFGDRIDVLLRPLVIGGGNSSSTFNSYGSEDGLSSGAAERERGANATSKSLDTPQLTTQQFKYNLTRKSPQLPYSSIASKDVSKTRNLVSGQCSRATTVSTVSCALKRKKPATTTADTTTKGVDAPTVTDQWVGAGGGTGPGLEDNTLRLGAFSLRPSLSATVSRCGGKGRFNRSDYFSYTTPFASSNHNGSMFCIVGTDGAVRLFNSESCMGVGLSRKQYPNRTKIIGKRLRCRHPYGKQSYDSAGDGGWTGACDDDDDDEEEDDRLDAKDDIENFDKNFDPQDKKKKKPSKKEVSKEKTKEMIRNWKNMKASEGSSSHKTHKNLASVDTAQLALFELTSLTPSEDRVTTAKLRLFLENNGEYPEKYRTMIWRFLLKLPENSAHFVGTHPILTTL